MKPFFTFLLVAGLTISLNAQCVLVTGSYTQAQVLACLNTNGSVSIPNGQTVSLSGDWDLSSKGAVFLTVYGSLGSLVFSGTGGNRTELILGNGSTITVDDPTNASALTSPSTGNVYITFQGTPATTFQGNQIPAVVSGGGASNNGIGTLPVELLYFSGSSEEQMVQLEWATASEINNDFFTILRSLDGENWKEIGTVRARGNSSETNAYSFIDFNPLEANNLYRLKQTDFDGESEIIGLVNISTLNSKEDQIIYLSPSQVEIIHNERMIPDLNSIRVFNIMGNDVTQNGMFTLKNDKSVIVNLDMLNSGVFYIRTKTKVYKVFNK